MPSPGATVPAQARPTKVGVPSIEVSASTGGVPLAEVAVYWNPAKGPESIVATTRYGLKSSSVPIRNFLFGESSDWCALPSGEIS